MGLVKVIWLLILVVLTQQGHTANVTISRAEMKELKRELKILNKKPVKSIKVTENDIYDCIDIYKQPSLDHPLLKNHTIQMKPSRSPKWVGERSSSGWMNYSRPVFMSEPCPAGTVPIRRTRMRDLINAKLFGKPQSPTYTLQTSDKPGGHLAALRTPIESTTNFLGIKATISVHSESVVGDQASYAQISVEGASLSKFNSIQVGWMVQPNLFGDTLPRSFGFWMGDNRRGCYNQLCLGFVQISDQVKLGEPMGPTSVYGGAQHFIDLSLYMDYGNWWVYANFEEEKSVGYWPKELFSQIGDGATNLAFGGYTQAGGNGVSPPMGSGHFPDGIYDHSGQFLRMHVVNQNGELVEADKFPMEHLLDSSSCYALDYKGFTNNDLRVNFLYGGPGGDNCGI